MRNSRTITRISTWLAGLVALLVMCLPPLSYGIFSYQYLQGSVTSEVEINSRIISNLINTNPLLWNHEELRLEEILARRPDSGESESRRLVDLQGRLIAASVSPLPPPLFKKTQEVMDAGQAVARLEIVRSLQPLLLKTGVAALIGLFLGVVLFVPLRILPIRALKKAEETLRESRSLLLSVLENVPIRVFWKGIDLNYLGCNTAFAHSVGYSQHEDLLGKDDFRMCWRGQAEFYRADDKWVMDSKTPKVGIEKQQPTPDGQTIWIRTSKVPLIDAEGTVIGLLGIDEEITARKKAEEEKQTFEQQLQHAQKLESLGVLSGGIAHDFNNILAIIIGYCGLTKLRYESAEKNIPEIEKAAERAAGLCRQMLAYAGNAHLTKTKINMVTKVDDIVGMLKSTLPQNAAIKTALSAKIPLIDGDASQLRQVVMNLIINASEAIGTEQGEVNVSLTRVEVESGKSDEDYHGKAIHPGEYVCLEVTDNGCGMDDAIKWRIFEPFYTTKFTGRGLGMSAVLGIIKSHAGALQLFTQLGHGTTFKVYLPALASDTAKDEEQSVPVPALPWQGSGTILLAEDETQVRHIAKELLEMFGFAVLEAVNGKEELEIYLKNAVEITLVVTDMGMPVMDGYELFSELKKINPELPIIISSGYGDTEVNSRIGIDKIAGIISKPYNTDQLREILKSVVEGTASTSA